MASRRTTVWTKATKLPYVRHTAPCTAGLGDIGKRRFNGMQETSQGGKPGNGSAPSPAISLSGVNLSLGRGAARVHILKSIDLHIGAGEAIGLVGPSGSGKSTLLMVMAGLERADAGTVRV